VWLDSLTVDDLVNLGLCENLKLVILAYLVEMLNAAAAFTCQMKFIVLII